MQNDFFPYAPGQHFVARFCISKTPNGMKAIGIFAPFFAVEQRVFKRLRRKSSSQMQGISAMLILTMITWETGYDNTICRLNFCTYIGG